MDGYRSKPFIKSEPEPVPAAPQQPALEYHLALFLFYQNL